MIATRTLLFLLVCTVITLMVLNYEETVVTHKTVAAVGHEPPESILEQMVSTRYQPDGKIYSQLTSDHVEYFKQTDTTTVAHPYYIVYNQNGYTWHARADQALVFKENDGAQLTGNVRVWQPERQAELDTSTLLIKPEIQYAETDKPVVIKSPYGTTDATGMKLDMNAETLNLLSAVHGTYEKP